MEKEDQHYLTILSEIAEGRPVTPRSVAQKPGIALGLTNLYLKRLARKGYIQGLHQGHDDSREPGEVSPHPKGFAEKTQLTYKYMELFGAAVP